MRTVIEYKILQIVENILIDIFAMLNGWSFLMFCFTDRLIRTCINYFFLLLITTINIYHQKVHHIKEQVSVNIQHAE